jgi:polar amino acid transport system substrate-binding protein
MNRDEAEEAAHWHQVSRTAAAGMRAASARVLLIAALPIIAHSISAMATDPPSPQAVAELAPMGKLRAVINTGNPILAARNAATGELEGVSVDLARELARRLSASLELSGVDTAAKSVAAIKSGACDVAFVAIDPARAVDMDYTAPYVLIEGAYLVPQASAIISNAEVDREGVRVVVGGGSAYDLYLSRELRKAQLVRAPTSQAVVDLMLAQHLDVAAGVKQQLEADAKRVAGVRLLGGRFMVINQAMATPRGRPAGVRYLAEFVEQMKASGFVAGALRRHAIDGAVVAPPAGSP